MDNTVNLQRSHALCSLAAVPQKSEPPALRIEISLLASRPRVFTELHDSEVATRLAAPRILFRSSVE